MGPLMGRPWWQRWLRRVLPPVPEPAPAPVMPRSAWALRLEAAIEAAHPSCLECGNANITIEYRPDLGEFIPVSHHWAANGPGDSCPVLSGGLAAWQCHEDLWEALDPHLGRADYGEEAWMRRELVTA
jgi:hypothetical protein